jgi:hypothetical protein
MAGPRLRGNRCQCPTCGELFNSVSGFDRHRMGDFAKSGELRHYRCCLSPAKMTAQGWSRNVAGFWIRQARNAVTICAQGPRVTLPATGVQGVVR